MQTKKSARFYRVACVGYNGRMPQEKRDARVTIFVTREAKAVAQAIARAKTTPTVKWSETDVWEAAVLAFAKQKDIREALAKIAEEGE